VVKTIVMAVRLSEKMYRRVLKVAEINETDKSTVLRAAVREYFKNKTEPLDDLIQVPAEAKMEEYLDE
jgi:predicted transcriptional regulator